MALSANTVFEVEYAGADSNGGGFVTGSGGTDYSQQSAAQGSGTNLTVDSSSNTKVNPDGYTVVAGDVGNLIQITSTGSGSAFTTGVYQITAASTGTSSTQALDARPIAGGDELERGDVVPRRRLRHAGHGCLGDGGVESNLLCQVQ